MAKNIRISDTLYDIASSEAKLQHRSLAQQVEYWAKLGMAAGLGVVAFSPKAIRSPSLDL